MQYARDLIATASAIKQQVTAALDTDDLLRSALVQGVSAFDHFVHEEVRARMIEIANGLRPSCQAYSRFRVSLDSVRVAQQNGGTAWLDTEIREQHGYLSFQHPDKVADAFRLASDVQLWPGIATHLQLTIPVAKRRLLLIVDRRNKIAHEADTDPTPPRSRYRIDAQLVTDALDYVDAVVDAVVAVVT